MSPLDEKIKNFVEPKAEKIVSKIEKTPMEKFFVFFLILITVSSLVLGYLQFKKNIEGPAFAAYLDRKRGEYLDQYNQLYAISEDELVSELKNQDSDLDGLNDWHEINLYGTSPYLSDSDNDKISDQEEILQGTDPNCPEGQTCGVNANALPVSEEEAISGELNLTEADLNTLLQYQQELLAGTKTVADLGIDSPELQKMYDQLRSGELSGEDLEAAAIESGTTKAQSEEEPELSTEDRLRALEEMKKMTPDQIREELIKKGMSQDDVDAIDDNTLQEIFNEILTQYPI